ncbi:MAG: phenylacetic acid degradation operon negative regulatory protein [Patescibacteria group bacterium]|jgi:DNA-binding transcriptional regulator PaaX|nr:phenylacetic acid degradation operon negative regulatory protein [Patescibacteria group bacterium]
MTNMKKISKSQELLKKVAQKGVATEASLLEDKALLELFSWNTARAPRARIKDTLAILTRQGALTQGRIDTEKLYKITSRGLALLKRGEVRKSTNTPLHTPSSWNKRWLFVTYQIPETHKIARNQFLIELKRLGFLRFSSALWIYPYDISVQIKKIATHLTIENYVDILRADSISQPAVWKRRFKL